MKLINCCGRSSLEAQSWVGANTALNHHSRSLSFPSPVPGVIFFLGPPSCHTLCVGPLILLRHLTLRHVSSLQVWHINNVEIGKFETVRYADETVRNGGETVHMQPTTFK